MPRRTNAAPVTIGIDPGKNTFHLIGLDARGGIVLREKVARDRVVARLSNMAPCLIGIEAGMGTHYVTRELLAIGHDVRQVPPVYAKPFRQTHKNDFRDAHATAEAVQRPTTRCVPAKTDEQLDLQALHRVRYRLVGQRTAVINQIRSFLLEHGITVRQRLHWLRHALPDILAQRTDVLSPRMIRILADLAEDWRRLDDIRFGRHGRAWRASQARQLTSRFLTRALRQPTGLPCANEGRRERRPTQTNAFTLGYPQSQVITLIPAVSVLRKPGTLHPYDAETLTGRRLHHHPPPQTAHHLGAQVL
jgi:hypothetical protein